MEWMFQYATSFNMDLCSWRDNFPYTDTANSFWGSSVFIDSGCTYQDAPNEVQKGPFCASDCQSSQVVSCKYFFSFIHNLAVILTDISFHHFSSSLLFSQLLVLPFPQKLLLLHQSNHHVLPNIIPQQHI